MLSIVAGIANCVSALHPSKALSSMAVTPVGIVMPRRTVHPLKASAPITVRPAGILMYVIFVLPVKAPEPIRLIPLVSSSTTLPSTSLPSSFVIPVSVPLSSTV